MIIRRKGGRAAAALLEVSGPGDESPPDPDESPQAENGEPAGEDASASVAYDSPDEDETDNHSSAISGDSIEPLDSALPAEAGDTVEVDLPTDESTDSEADEASDNEIHDLALAVESSGFSHQGHEVTSRPSDDDQGETVRIVTEAVEHGGPGREMAPAVSPAAGAAEPARPNPPNSSNPCWIVNLMKASRMPATCRSHSRSNPKRVCRPDRPASQSPTPAFSAPDAAACLSEGSARSQAAPKSLSPCRGGPLESDPPVPRQGIGIQRIHSLGRGLHGHPE